MAPLEDVHRGLHRQLLQRNPVGHGVLHARLDGEGRPVHGSAEVGEVEPLPSLCRHQPWRIRARDRERKGQRGACTVYL